MTDDQRFEVILQEVAGLQLQLSIFGLGDDLVVIGAQVVALEQRMRNQPPFELTTATGAHLVRGFSLEPDLVIDTDDLNQLEELPHALRQCGFERTTRPGRPSTWVKSVGEVVVEIDLFTTANCDLTELPTPMTRLRGANAIRTHSVRLVDSKTIRVPDPYMFLSLKLEAKLRIRPQLQKDSLDLYAYVHVVGPDEINGALLKAGTDAARVRSELKQLFGGAESPGVRDVLGAAGSTMAPEERELLAQAVVDAFEPVIGP